MTQIEKIIRKHYLPSKRVNNPRKRGWEACGNEIYSLIRKKEGLIRAKNLQYSEQCRKIDEVSRKIENEYNSFFQFTNINGIIAGYDWVNGNNKLKQLLEPAKD